MPTISVIVPVYRVESYLRPCVDGILAQTYPDFELILIDDGSPDRCGEICDEYAAMDSRVRVIHQSNNGLSAARNAGLDIMRGEYVAFVDSDDCVHPKYLETLLTAIQTYSAQVSQCQMVEFEDHDAPPTEASAAKEALCISGREVVRHIYERAAGFSVCVWGRLYEAALFTSLRFPVGKIHEDQAVTPRALFCAARVAVTYVPLYYYRLRDGSITHSTFSARRYDDLEAIDTCIRFFQEHADTELASLAEARKQELMAVYALLAREDHVSHVVPKPYRMSEYRALKYLRTHLSDDRYTYQLAKLHPNWVLPHEYLRKIKKILHIPCN